MSKLVSIFVFSAALFIGVIVVPIENPTVYEKVYPLFSQSEANSLLGRRVKNKFVSKNFAGMKYSLKAEENFISEHAQIGETGEIVALQELENGYILQIKWDKQDKYGRDMYSFDQRFSSRLFLEFE